METILLEAQRVTKVFGGGFLRRSATVAVRDVSLSIAADPARIVTVAGESGSGKTTLAQMALGFVRPTAGRILYRGVDIHRMPRREFARYRREVQAVFQNPFEAYNHFYKIDHVFDLVVRRFRLAANRAEACHLVDQALHVVRLDPGAVLGKYPYQLSGGQLQRIMIARAFMLKPRLLVADEPVSMIDASLRAVVLDIMVTLKRDFGISQLYITHDLSTAFQISDEVLITYRGSVVERGAAEAVIQNPQHPYTQLLVQSIPLPDPEQRWQEPVAPMAADELLAASLEGCPFYGRCRRRMDVCARARPHLRAVGGTQAAACFLYEGEPV